MKRQKCKKNKTIQNILDMHTECKRLEYGSPEQLESIELREEVLRKPIGLRFSKEELEEDEQFHLAYIMDGKVVGILLLKPVAEGVLKMRQVAVRPDLQGQGIGKQLVRFSEKWAIDHQYHIMELHARKTAVEFYLSMGYETRGPEFLEVTIPHLEMFKNLK